jgi:hypothetical protein
MQRNITRTGQSVVDYILAPTRGEQLCTIVVLMYRHKMAAFH